jgi:hypothetical protein
MNAEHSRLNKYRVGTVRQGADRAGKPVYKQGYFGGYFTLFNAKNHNGKFMRFSVKPSNINFMNTARPVSRRNTGLKTVNGIPIIKGFFGGLKTINGNTVYKRPNGGYTTTRPFKPGKPIGRTINTGQNVISTPFHGLRTSNNYRPVIKNQTNSQFRLMTNWEKSYYLGFSPRTQLRPPP